MQNRVYLLTQDNQLNDLNRLAGFSLLLLQCMIKNNTAGIHRP